MLDPRNCLERYRDELTQRVLPFWEKHSLDQEKGGFFTCLLEGGQVFDTDKFVWLQARQVWTFAMLYNRLEARPEWLRIARHGADFLRCHGRDERGDWYFALDRSGKPLVQPYNIFSDCFAAMAFGQLYVATGEEADARLARETFDRILLRRHHPKGVYEKSVPGARPQQNFALPMILSNLCLELEALLDPDLVGQTIEEAIHTVMNTFFHPDWDLVLENVGPDGAFLDSMDGRLINPGHAIEAMWFMMDLGERLGRPALIQAAARRALRMLQYGWDETFGGIFYFLDLRGYPPQQLEWDQKLWWVHLESLIAMLQAYRHTQEPVYWQWFEEVHLWTWPRFSDPEHGEWFGYLNRRGERLYGLKGGKWKGCFHLPRALFRCGQLLESILADTSQQK